MHKSTMRLVVLGLLATCAMVQAETPKRVLLLGQKRDHPPGSHEYMTGMQVLQAALENCPEIQTQVVAADEPWPEGPEMLAKADAVVLYLGEAGRWAELDPAREKALHDLTQRGGGIVALHWGIGAKDAKYIAGHRARIGAVHGGPDRKYIITKTPYPVEVLRHPITTGIDDFQLRDEYYYQLKRADSGTVTPLLLVPIDGNAEMEAWAYERPDGGRSFGFAGMHYHDNWKLLTCRRMIAQGVLWTLKLPIPKEGLAVEVPAEVYVLPQDKTDKS